MEEIGTPRRRIEGRGQIVEAFRAWAKAIPDASGVVTDVVAEDGKVAIEVRWEGTMTGPFGDFSPTGRRQRARAALFFHFEGERIRELRHYYDSQVIFQLLGISP
jgi:steroid delta-isomerase-like uncharacterized protein